MFELTGLACTWLACSAYTGTQACLRIEDSRKPTGSCTKTRRAGHTAYSLRTQPLLATERALINQSITDNPYQNNCRCFCARTDR